MLPYHRAMPGRAPLRLSVALTALVVLLPAGAGASEAFHYRWKLQGFIGALASIFVPSRGEGLLTVEPLDDGLVRGELTVTSRHSGSGEYFRYGADFRAEDGATVRAWSDLVWRGEKKSKEQAIDDPAVVDVVSGILSVRRSPPERAERMEIWSDGKLYPILVVPGESEPRTLGGRQVEARVYSFRGVALPGRPVWKGELELWLADDREATPVEILVSRRGAKVRLILDPEAADPEDRHEGPVGDARAAATPDRRAHPAG